MPEVLNPGDGFPKSDKKSNNDMIEYNYTYRVNSKIDNTENGDANNELAFLNCFVSFREVMNSSTQTMRRQSLVIVSKFPFPHFAYRLLGKIEEALWHVFSTPTLSESSNTTESKGSPASQALITAYGQLQGWPAPAPDTPLSLPFYGEVLVLQFLMCSFICQLI